MVTATRTLADPLHLAVALDGAGWHPAAWREPDAQPDRLFTAAYWVGLAQRAERGLLDFVTIEDGLDLQSDDHFGRDERTDRVRGRLDAVLIAARAAPRTRAHRASSRRRSPPTPSRSTCPRRSPRSTTSAPAARACACRSPGALTRRRTSAGARSRR